MKNNILKVIYKGIDQGQVNRSFTFNKVYLCQVIRENLLLVLNDDALLVEIDSVYFEFLNDESCLIAA